MLVIAILQIGKLTSQGSSVVGNTDESAWLAGVKSSVALIAPGAESSCRVELC
jgi:hypothetical protein